MALWWVPIHHKLCPENFLAPDRVSDQPDREHLPFGDLSEEPVSFELQCTGLAAGGRFDGREPEGVGPALFDPDTDAIFDGRPEIPAEVLALQGVQPTVGGLEPRSAAQSQAPPLGGLESPTAEYLGFLARDLISDPPVA